MRDNYNPNTDRKNFTKPYTYKEKVKGDPLHRTVTRVHEGHYVGPRAERPQVAKPKVHGAQARPGGRKRNILMPDGRVIVPKK